MDSASKILIISLLTEGELERNEKDGSGSGVRGQKKKKKQAWDSLCIHFHELTFVF